MLKTILNGHVSPNTAYVVDDYPYGFHLRCKIRYWIETRKGMGQRLCAQTTNPKKNNEWNKPKASTYSGFLIMGLDESNHVASNGFTHVSPEVIEQFIELCDNKVDPVTARRLKEFETYSRSRQKDQWEQWEITKQIRDLVTKIDGGNAIQDNNLLEIARKVSYHNDIGYLKELLDRVNNAMKIAA